MIDLSSEFLDFWYVSAIVKKQSMKLIYDNSIDCKSWASRHKVYVCNAITND